MIELRDYQKEISEQGAELLRKYKICYLAMECRTGKTLTALAVAQKYGAESVLVVTKLKAIPSIRKDYETLGARYDFDIINYESVSKKLGNYYDLIILDEAHSIGAFPRPSQRTKNVKEICKKKPIIYLSGTPSPESYAQLYHQFWVSSYSPFLMYTNFYKWAKEFVDKQTKLVNGIMIQDYSHVYKDKMDEYTKHLFIDFTQEEAGFEANIREYVEFVEMTAWTHEALKRLKKDKVIVWNQGKENETTLLGDTPAKLISKLHQISSGTVITEDGKCHLTDFSKARYILNRFRGQKIAIFYVYQGEAEILEKAFPNHTRVPEEFQAAGNDMVFIGQVRSVREGVRLDTADALIFYNMEYSYLSYEQGRNRLSSKEREKPANVYFLCSDCGVEEFILRAVMEKQDFTLSYYSRRGGFR